MTRNDKRFLAKLTKTYLKFNRGIGLRYGDIYQLIENGQSRDEIDLIQFADYCVKILYRNVA